MSKPARTCLLLFLLAFAVRIGAGLWTGMSREPVEDERGYVDYAGSVFGDPIKAVDFSTPDAEYRIWRDYRDGTRGCYCRVSFRSPVVPALFAPVALVGGGVRWMRVVAMLFGALGPPLLFLALRNSRLGDRAWWPAAALALWPPATYVSIRALSEAPSQAFLLGAVALLVSEKKRAAGWAGALAGLAVLARPSALIPAGLLAFAAGSVRRALVFLLVFAVVVDVWVARNWHLHGRPMLTSNSGVTLVGGNSRAAADAEHPGKWVKPELVYGKSDDPPDLGMWGWSSMNEEASDARFTKDAMTFVRENPGDAMTLCFWKVVRLFDPDPHSGKDDATSKALVGWLTLTPVLVLAVIGARRSERVWWMLLAGTVVTAVIFYGDTRMRTCADPALLVFAAYGVVVVAERLKARAVH